MHTRNGVPSLSKKQRDVTRLVAILVMFTFQIVSILHRIYIIHDNIFASQRFGDVLQAHLRQILFATFHGLVDDGEQGFDLADDTSRPQHEVVLA
jgi:hypothetical protein